MFFCGFALIDVTALAILGSFQNEWAALESFAYSSLFASAVSGFMVGVPYIADKISGLTKTAAEKGQALIARYNFEQEFLSNIPGVIQKMVRPFLAMNDINQTVQSVVTHAKQEELPTIFFQTRNDKTLFDLLLEGRQSNSDAAETVFQVSLKERVEFVGNFFAGKNFSRDLAALILDYDIYHSRFSSKDNNTFPQLKLAFNRALGVQNQNVEHHSSSVLVPCKSRKSKHRRR